MNRLKPKIIAPQVFEVIQIPALGVVVQIGKRAALVHLIAACVDIERVDLVKIDVARPFWGNGEGMIAPAIRGVIIPGAAAVQPIACGQPVGAGLLRVERRVVLPAARKHGVRFVIMTIIRADDIAVRRTDPLFGGNAVSIGIGQRRVIAAV